jgi:HK97 gp10 family phage protein
MTSKVTGFKEIDRALKRFPEKLQKKALNKAVRASTKPTIKAAKQFAQKSRKTGALQRNIKTRRGKAKFNKDASITYLIGVEHGRVPKKGLNETFRGQTRTRRGKLRRLTVRERRGEDPFYFQWVEFGFRHRGGGRVPARPFLRPALKRTQARSTAIMRRELRKFVDNERGN